MSDRAAAERRVRRIRAFRAELDELIAGGVVSLSDAQRAAIDAHHAQLLETAARAFDVDRTAAAGQLSRGMRIAAFFAAVTLTAAMYSLVAQFWGRLELPVQATLLCAFPLAALVGVELSARRERTLYIASIFAIVAYGTFWLAVAMLSELLNVPVLPPAIWAGALFGVALALPYGFRLVLAVALAALLLAFSGSVFQMAGVPWTAAVEHIDILTIAALVLGAAASQLRVLDPAFAMVARLVGFGIGLLGLLLLSNIGQISLLTSSPRVSATVYQIVMLLLCVGLLIVAVRREWRDTVALAATGLTLLLFSRFVDWFWATLPRYLFFLALAAVAFAWLLALRRLRARLGHGGAA